VPGRAVRETAGIGVGGRLAGSQGGWPVALCLPRVRPVRGSSTADVRTARAPALSPVPLLPPAGSAAMAVPGRRAWLPPCPVRWSCDDRAAASARRRRAAFTVRAAASAPISTQAAITASRTTVPARPPKPAGCAVGCVTRWVAGGADRADDACGDGAECAAAMAAAAVTAPAASRAP
jgi:hypothetical protein